MGAVATLDGWDTEVMDVAGPRVDRLLIRPPRNVGGPPTRKRSHPVLIPFFQRDLNLDVLEDVHQLVNQFLLVAARGGCRDVCFEVAAQDHVRGAV